LLTGGLVALVLALAIGLVVAKVASPSPPRGPTPPPEAPADVVRELTHVPPRAFGAAGVPPAWLVRWPVALRGLPFLAVGRKPVVVWVGDEFSPYAAVERLVLVIALARFGTFRHLGLATSSQTDVFPGTESVSLAGASYDSPFVALWAYERYGDQSTRLPRPGFAPLEAVLRNVAALVARVDGPPQLSGVVPGTLPFLDVANRFAVPPASVSPGILHAMSLTTLAGSLGAVGEPSAAPVSTTTSAASPPTPAMTLLGAANELTAAICAVDGAKPASVCATAPMSRLFAHP
jgi:hypothetical protein